MNCSSHKALAALLMAASIPLQVAAAAEAAECRRHSGDAAPAVVELYTSEGCSSCPPADRWLSRLPNRDRVVALAFHVDYWDRLGWKDRFGDARYTRRQQEQQRVSGARFSYTPQVIVDGIDRPEWPALAVTDASRERPSAPARASLRRDGTVVIATVMPTGAASPARLAAYWAVTESGHASAVKAGENAGVTLAHDHVVVAYQPVVAWRADTPIELRFEPAPTGHRPRRTALIVIDADTGRPVQAVQIDC